MNPHVRVRLPVLYCSEPGCGTQLVNGLFNVVGTDTLVCLFCAVARDRAGRGATVAALDAESAGFLSSPAPALDPFDAVALLVRRGGSIEVPR